MDQTNTEDQQSSIKKFWLRDQATHKYTGAEQKWAWFDCCFREEGETRNTTNHFHMISLVEAYKTCTMGLRSVNENSILFEQKRGGWNGSGEAKCVLRCVEPRTNREISCFSPSHITPTPMQQHFVLQISYDIHYERLYEQHQHTMPLSEL